MLNATVGQLLVNEAIPEELRDYNRVLDKKGMHSLLQEVARKHPDKYREISFKLNQIGQRAAQDQGGMSFGMQHLRRSKAANAVREKIQANIGKILEDDSLSDKERADRIVRVVGKEMNPQQKAILEEAIANNNPLAMQVLSGSRGKPMNLASLLGSDMLYSDHRDEVIPIPVLRSYSEGLTPEEYWAGTYGARRGIIATKFATQEAGFLSKQLNQAGHRLVVMDEEGDDDPTRGMIVDTDDMDNEGALLARDMGPYKRNTPLTPKILKHLKRLGKNRILIRSPLVGGSPEGGVYARDVGIRETGELPGRGEQVGLQAAQALSEPISQGQLSAKHSGGVAGEEKAVGGFQYINQLIQTPKRMQGGAAHSELDGTVQRVEEAPQGGHFVTINDKKHYVGEGFKLKVKKGNEVEAGDVISDGIPNPAIIVEHKGVGEGRRYFVNEFRKAMESSGMRGHRRNIELLARGLINHVQLTEETDDNAPDDIIPYSTLEHTYKPREGHQILNPRKAVGQYLERPVLHYTIGTKIRPSMLKDMEEFGISEIPVHKEPPPFKPHMVRGMYQLQHDPDWMTQMYGSGLKKSLLTSTARGATSEERGSSFIPSLATGVDFGRDPSRAVIKPQPGYELPKVEEPEQPKPAEPPKPQGVSFFGGRFKVGMHKQAEEPKITKSPAAPKQPATQSLAAPTSPTPAPSGAHDLTPNIMPLQNPATATNQPELANNLADDFTDHIGDRIDVALGQEPGGPTPPPANQAQQQTDAVQRSRSMAANVNQQSVLANPATAQMIGQSMQGQSGLGSLFMLGGFADPRSMGQLMSGHPSRNLAGNEMMRDLQSRQALQQARQRMIPAQMNQAAQQNMQMQSNGDPFAPHLMPQMTPAQQQQIQDDYNPPVQRPYDEGPIPEQMPMQNTPGNGLSPMVNNGIEFFRDQDKWSYGSNVWNAARQGNLVSKPSLGGINPQAQKFTKAVGDTFRAAVRKVPGVSRFVAATGDDALRAAGTTGSKGMSKVLGPAAFLVEGGFIAKDLYDKTQQGSTLDQAWSDQANDYASKTRGLLTDWDDGLHEIYKKPLDVAMHVMSPVSSAQMATELVRETGGGLMDVGKATGTKIYDMATWSTPESRHVENMTDEVQQMQGQRQEQLAAKKEQIKEVLESNQTMSPTQKQQLKQQYEELDAQIQDSIQYAKSMEDETADWELGKQHVFGGGHYFRDAMSGTANRLSAKIKKLESVSGPMTPQRQLELENMKARMNEANQLQDLYDREVGYFGEGDFTKIIRVRVRDAKTRMIELGKRMREPAVRSNPKLMMQLQADYQHAQQRLNNFKGWARQAKDQKVRQ